ncbi:MAG: hypothetical protein A2Y12_03250 [Planctomycetes bacterium GWF2_42_9]|nr:MAG: hypothetical protein A2Y12_03250 [Planctomycetes bacterium GWF2_42_9]
MTVSSIFDIASRTEPIGLLDVLDTLAGQSFTYEPPGPNRQSGILLKLFLSSIFHILVFFDSSFYFLKSYQNFYRQNVWSYPNKNRTNLKNFKNRRCGLKTATYMGQNPKNSYLRLKRELNPFG